MLLRLLVVAAVLLAAPVAAQDGAPSSEPATQASPQNDTSEDLDVPTELPVSLDRIRERLLESPEVPAIKGLNAQPTFRTGVEERLTLEILHRDEESPLGLTEVVNVDDVGMLHERRDACFVQQHVDERLLGREVVVHELDDNQLLEPRRSPL